MPELPEPVPGPLAPAPVNPGFLTAYADELVSGQYADRPALRPVLDAVLAAAPALGPVTVQARKSCVSLVEDALRPGRRLVAGVRLTDARGNPGCADLAWSVERAP
jgi:hypothetical protein